MNIAKTSATPVSWFSTMLSPCRMVFLPDDCLTCECLQNGCGIYGDLPEALCLDDSMALVLSLVSGTICWAEAIWANTVSTHIRHMFRRICNGLKLVLWGNDRIAFNG